MKIYIVLEFRTIHRLTGTSSEHCRVDRVYLTKKKAERRVKMLTKHHPDFTFGIITKPLKGAKGVFIL